MGHHIMLIGNSNGMWYMFAEVGRECSIADSWLPKCHELNMVQSIVDLQKNCMPLKETLSKTTTKIATLSCGKVTK